MTRIRMVVEYEGTNYVGWQLQENGVSVQQKLNEALYAVTGEAIRVHGSGRTDSGVHARAQVAHFDTAARMPADKFAFALNSHLPRDIRVLYSGTAEPDFHARFSVTQKSYRYTVQTGPHARVSTRTTALHVHTPLDLAALREAAQEALGEHDFAAFMAAGGAVETTVRRILASDWSKDGPYLHYDVTGTGFLYNMVRILVGTMLEIGAGKRAPGAIARAIAGGRREDGGPTAPAQGLCLMRVRYPDFDTEAVLGAL